MRIALMGVSSFAAYACAKAADNGQLPVYTPAPDSGEVDAAAPDATPQAPVDAAPEAALPDSSNPDGAPHDGGQADAADSSTPDAGIMCTAAYAGCDVFVEESADGGRGDGGDGGAIALGDGGIPSISFANYNYAPKCLKIHVGQKVAFDGNFIAHPLDQGCGPSMGVLVGTAGTHAEFTLTTPGIYGYYCTAHGEPDGRDMAGAIEVVSP